MTSPNGLICFKNCFLPREDGKLIKKDLWIDEERGIILDAQKTFFLKNQRPERIINLQGNILSPGFLDIQINGAYGFDFSVYDGDDEAYRNGLKLVSRKIVETGVTSLVPTIITQEKSLYPKLLELLRPLSLPSSANLLGWHAEGPFLQMAKRGAHDPPFILSAKEGFSTFEQIYGAKNLADEEDWALQNSAGEGGVRIITAAPEIEGVMDAIHELTQRGVAFSIGHSIATSDIAVEATKNGAKLITHLFNAMPQLHHRDPSIIGLLGASSHLHLGAKDPVLESVVTAHAVQAKKLKAEVTEAARSEALDDIQTPPQSPILAAQHRSVALISPLPSGIASPRTRKPALPGGSFERPFYEMIVDGIHSHPHSVRLAYNAYPDGCILITDAMKILDPHLRDGVHEWRDGKRFVKEGDKLYLEGTTTLAGSVVTLDKCVRNFSLFTGCSLAEAIKCATYNPAKCLGIQDKKGSLRPGADADLVVLDQKGNVLATWVKGREVWKRE